MLTELGFTAARQALIPINATTEDDQYTNHSLYSDIKNTEFYSIPFWRESVPLSFPLAYYLSSFLCQDFASSKIHAGYQRELSLWPKHKKLSDS